MLDDTTLIPVPPNRLSREWGEEVVDLIEEANRKMPLDMLGEPFDPETVLRQLYSGMRQLWLVRRDSVLLGLGLTGLHVEDITGRRSVRLLLVAGRQWSAWAWTLGAIEAWARDQGCSFVRVEGRKGWARRLPEAYRPTGEQCGAAGRVWERSLLNG